MIWLFKLLSSIFRNIFNLYRQDRNYIYKIEEINECSNRVVLSCTGKGATLIIDIDSIGNDDYIINFLPPHHACWLGYHYGKIWYLQREKKIHLKQCHSACSDYFDYDSKFKIIYQNRLGEIVYQNTQNGSIQKMDLLELAKSKVISKFNSSQAFYIGFLAALKTVKVSNKTQNKSTNTFRHLTVVK